MSSIPTREWLNEFASDIVDTIREPLLILDDRLRVVWANDPFYRAFVLSPESTLGVSLAEIRGEEWNDSRLLELLVETLPRKRAVENFEIDHEFGELGRRMLLVNVREMQSAKTGERLVLLAIEDVTENRRVTAQQARLAALVESSDDAIIAQAFDGRIIDWNAGAEAIYGYAADEVLGQDISLLVPKDREWEPQRLRDALLEGKLIRNVETRRIGKDGLTFPVSMTMSPIRDAAGRVVLVSTVERDISPRVRREQELRQAKEIAEKASQARSEFVANVSHELRTPMNAIIGMTDLTLEEDLDADVRANLQIVRTSANVLMDLIDEVLDFSKLESGNFELEPAPFALRPLFDMWAKTMGMLAYEKGLEFVCDIDSDVPDRLVGDARRLRQVLSNLVSNAIKFTEAGELVVSVECLQRSVESVELSFSVRDTGVGISEVDQQRIFEPFTQVDTSTTRRHSGTGLGLAICRQLVELMGGQLHVGSHPRQGSTFTFTAKFDCVADGGDDSHAPKAPSRPLTGMPVLVVDDNETNRNLLVKTLSNWSLQPVAVASGKAALQLLRTAADNGRTFPLVILDALMPDMDGFEVALAIDRDPRLKSATVLMLSSADRKDFRERLNGLESLAYVEKPVSQSDLWDSIVSTVEGVPVKPDIEGVRRFRRPAARALNILLVEDTPANQKVVTRILEKRGHTVRAAPNGREALEQIASAEQAFDVVLMDLQMPIVDGYQATASIRNSDDEAIRAMPVIAMTAHAMPGDREKCLAAGMDSYLSKPIDAHKLITVVESYAVKKSLADRSGNESIAREPRTLPALLDLDAALTRLGGDRELLHDMLAYFTEDLPPLLQEIRTAWAERHAERLERAAHSAKGLLVNFDGERKVVKLAGQLQQLGHDGQFEDAATLIPKLERLSLRMVREALRLLTNER